MQCIKCQGNIRADFDVGGGLLIDMCSQCKGMWFDDTELARALGLSQLNLWSPAPAQLQMTNLNCLKCPGVQLTRFSILGGLAEVESCSSCHGVWLDSGEFMALKKNVKRPGKPVGRRVGQVDVQKVKKYSEGSNLRAKFNRFILILMAASSAGCLLVLTKVIPTEFVLAEGGRSTVAVMAGFSALISFFYYKNPQSDMWSGLAYFIFARATLTTRFLGITRPQIDMVAKPMFNLFVYGFILVLAWCSFNLVTKRELRPEDLHYQKRSLGKSRTVKFILPIRSLLRGSNK